MQIQSYLVNDFNHASYIINTPCNLHDTSYDAKVMQDNAYLGAKFLKYLSCYYGFYAGTSGATLSNPGPASVDYYYHKAQLQYPDTLKADGTTNPNSYCVSVYNASPENPALPSTTKDTWSCPYDPYDYPASSPNPGALHTPDNTLLDVTVSAYNEGTGTLYSCGICNPGYVKSVEGYIPQFKAGTLPTAS